jgi:hypothetical protein
VAARTPAEAVRLYVSPLQRVVSCFTAAVLTVKGGYFPSPAPHVLTFGELGDPVVLSGHPRLALSVVQDYRIVRDDQERGAWRVTTAGYVYELDDADGRRILGYHWHPETTADKPFPHLHVHTGTRTDAQMVSERIHLPTGRIALEDVLRLSVREFGVRPTTPTERLGTGPRSDTGGLRGAARLVGFAREAPPPTAEPRGKVS